MTAVDVPPVEEEGPEPVVPVGPAPVLFGATPTEAAMKMREIAAILKVELPANDFVDTLKYGKTDAKHVSAEGWAYIGALVGVSTRTRWTRRWEGMTVVTEWRSDGGRRVKSMKDVHSVGWESYIEVVTPSGAVVGGHEGMCLRAESRWAEADEYALRSMSQTRARGQALSGVLRHLAEMAGYRGTPAEEMTGVVDAEPSQRTESKNRGEPAGPKDWTQLWGWFGGMEVEGGSDFAKACMARAVKVKFDVDLSTGGTLTNEQWKDAMDRMVAVYRALVKEGFGEGVVPSPSKKEFLAAFTPVWGIEAPAAESPSPEPEKKKGRKAKETPAGPEEAAESPGEASPETPEVPAEELPPPPNDDMPDFG